MASKKFAKGSEEWQMFMDYWALCQKYWEPEDSDSYWEALISDADAFYKKYNTWFARKLVGALSDDLEKRLKDMLGGNRNGDVGR